MFLNWLVVVKSSHLLSKVLHFTMAQSVDSWVAFFEYTGIPTTEAKDYAETFVSNRIRDPSELTKEILQDLGINVIGDVMSILKHARLLKEKEKKPDVSSLVPPPSSDFKYRPSNITAPKLKSEMTHPEFRKFKVDWEVFKSITRLPLDQIAPHLYNSCEESVQNSIINTHNQFFELDEEAMLKAIEKIVTKSTNPAVHRFNFSKLCQSECESIKGYLVRLNSMAKDCEFECPNCDYDLAPMNVKDQLIRGINNSGLQTDILTKIESLSTLEAIIKHAEAYETALSDQSKLSDKQPDIAHMEEGKKDEIGRISEHKRNRYSKFKGKKKFPCSGCGSTEHAMMERSTLCPAWGKDCLYCKKPNHFADVCRKKNPESEPDSSAEALIAHVRHSGDGYTTASPETKEIPAELTPLLSNKAVLSKTVMIFPDSGAGICLGGPQHIVKMGLKQRDLLPCRKRVSAVGGSVLTCQGWLPVKFNVEGNITEQPLYICDRVDRLYFSRAGCTATKILPSSFPYPMNHPQVSCLNAANISNGDTESLDRPISMPYPPTEENIPKLKAFLLDKFRDSVFSKSTPFRSMKCKPAHIHLKSDAVPYATHVPIPVPIHWKEQVRADLLRDVENGVIEEVPVGDPVVWCSQMIVTAKKDGRPRRTVDLQKLNAQCLRETHHCQSPFRLACLVPPNTKKTVVDATDGYHAIELDEESKPLTTFITEWGRFRYRRLPQGYTAAGDAYTRRYDEIIKNVKDKIKIIDDTLLYKVGIEANFYHTYNYLVLCAENGVTLNPDKLQFCQDIVDWGGLKVTETGVCPSDSLISAIRDFPAPKDITGARSWFGLVNQVAWAHANATLMQPFRDLVKPMNLRKY